MRIATSSSKTPQVIPTQGGPTLGGAWHSMEITTTPDIWTVSWWHALTGFKGGTWRQSPWMSQGYVAQLHPKSANLIPNKLPKYVRPSSKVSEVSENTSLGDRGWLGWLQTGLIWAHLGPLNVGKRHALFGARVGGAMLSTAEVHLPALVQLQEHGIARVLRKDGTKPSMPWMSQCKILYSVQFSSHQFTVLCLSFAAWTGKQQKFWL